MHLSEQSYFVSVAGVFARQCNYLDWWVANKVLIRSRGIWVGLCIKKRKSKTMLLELMFAYVVRHLLWNMTSLLRISISVFSSPALLCHLVNREWWTGINIHVLRWCCQDVGAAKCPAAQPLPNRAIDPPACASSKDHQMCIQFCGMADKWFGAGDWQGLQWATLKAPGRSFWLVIVINFWLEKGCFYLFGCLKISQ